MAVAARGRIATLLAALRQLLRNAFQLGVLRQLLAKLLRRFAVLGRLLRLMSRLKGKGDSTTTVEGSLYWKQADAHHTVVSLDTVAFSMDPWARSSSGNTWTQFGSSQIEYTETSAEVSEVRETTYEEVVEEVSQTTQVASTTYQEEENRSRLQKTLSQSAIGISVSFNNSRIKPMMPEAFQRNIARSRL